MLNMIDLIVTCTSETNHGIWLFPSDMFLYFELKQVQKSEK